MFNAFLSDDETEVPLYASHAARTELEQTGRYIPSDFNKTNAFCNSAGRDISKGWLLLKRSDLDSLDLNSTLKLRFVMDGVEIPFYGLVVTKEPINLFPSYIPNHEDSLYLVEVADSRWRVHSPYFVQSIAKMYNVSSNAAGGTGGPTVMLADSLNGGVAWTWTQMVGDIWAVMATQLGAYPGLPFTPHGAPAGWIFRGVSAWSALCDVLERIGCVVRPDLTVETAQFSIVQQGATDVDADDAVSAAIAAKRKIHDGEYLSLGRRAPQYCRVFFHKVRSVPVAIPPWLENTVYNVDVATGIDGAEAGIYHPIWDDMLATMDSGGTVTNTVALAARAAERVADYVRATIEGGEREWQRFTGLFKVTPGSRYERVVWTANEGGVVTEVMAFPPRASTTGAGFGGAGDGSMAPTDYADAGTVQDLVRLGFPSQSGIDSTVIGGVENAVLYIDASLQLSQDATNFYYDETTKTFSVVGFGYFDIKNSKTLIVKESDTNIDYIKVDNSTHLVKIWKETIIVNQGYVKIDISLGTQQFLVWDNTNEYIKADDATGLLTFWNGLVTIASSYLKIIDASSAAFFNADKSDKTLTVGWPTKATSDTDKFAYWHYTTGKPTGTPPTKSGYWAWQWDAGNYRKWFYAQGPGKWLLECCWIIVKKTADYTAEYGDFIWPDTTSTQIDIDLPSPLLNQEIRIRTDTLTNPITVTGTGIGTTIPLLRKNKTFDFYSDGSNWFVDDDEPVTVQLTDAATIAWDLVYDGPIAVVTLGGNRTLGAPTNMRDGGTYILTIKQDGTGTRTLAWNAAYKFPSAVGDPTLSTGANDVDIVTFVSDGTYMYGIFQGDFV